MLANTGTTPGQEQQREIAAALAAAGSALHAPAPSTLLAATATPASSSSTPTTFINPWTNVTPPQPLQVPIAPYPPHPHLPYVPLPSTQSQLICQGCRTLLIFPQGAANVRCALCSAITAVPSHGPEMAQLVCGGCRTLLMYIRGATSVQCSCCQTVNVAAEVNQVAHVDCSGCRTTLVYAYGARTVKCALCQHITHVTMSNVRFPLPAQRPCVQPQDMSPTRQTVVVENPMTHDESGKLVSNVVVGVATDRK